MDRYLLAGVVSFALALVLTCLALKFFPRLGLMDRPQKYGLSRAPIPYYGGLMIFLAFLIGVFIFVPLERHVIGLLVGATLIVAVGFLDDLMNLSPFLRLFCQGLAGLTLAFFGIGILSINLPFLGTLDFNHWIVGGVPMLVVLFTVFWVMMIVNAMNFVDGISGINSGVSFVAGITMFFLSINPMLHENLASQQSVAMISLIMAMVSLGFLLFDFPVPKILMGDTGSTLLGFLIATLAIFSGGKVATAFLVLGLPILDMAWVILRRICAGQKFWKGDLKHLHHRLMDRGFSERKVVAFYLVITAIFGFSAVSLVSSKQKFFVLIALVILMLVLAGSLIFLPKKGKG